LVLCTTAFFKVTRKSSAKDLGDLGTGQWARESVLASLGVLDLLANKGGGLEVKSGRGGIHGLVEEVQDDVTGGLGQGAGGKVADQTPVALLGLVGHDGSDHQVGLLFVVDLDGEALPAAKVVSESSQGGGLQEEGATQTNNDTRWWDEDGGSGGSAQSSEGSGNAGSSAGANGGGGQCAQDGVGGVQDGGQGGDGKAGLHGEHGDKGF